MANMACTEGEKGRTLLPRLVDKVAEREAGAGFELESKGDESSTTAAEATATTTRTTHEQCTYE